MYGWWIHWHIFFSPWLFDTIGLEEVEASQGRGKGHWPPAGIYVHRSTQIRKMRVLTTLDICIFVIT
jgi:hypothetical protein